MRKIRKKEIGYIIGAVLIIIVLLLPIKITNHINSEAKIIPAREWILQKSEDGSIRISDVDHRKNIVHNVSAYQVERGDFIEFRMNNTLADLNEISKNDTIGIIYSVETERELANLNRDLANAESFLKVSKTGEKEAIIKMAQERVNQAKIQLENQEKIVERKKKLFENNLISEEEYEINKNTAIIYERELLEAKANLANLKTGAKPEEIALYENEVISTKLEIQRINELLSKFTLQSPMDGYLYRVFSTDTLLIIGDTLSVAVIPVRSEDINKITIGQAFTINMNLNETGLQPEGKIININKMTEYIDQKATILVTGIISVPLKKLPINAVLGCAIETESILLRDYIFDFVISIFK
ncbi:MAG: hypothetical protein P8Y99_05375 [Calditrichaceae bacterium]